MYWSIGLGLTRPHVQIDAAKIAALGGYKTPRFSVLRRKLLGD